MSLMQKIQLVVSSELGIPMDEISTDLKYGETPEWDSNSHMVLVIALEEAFNVTFESDEIVELVTLDGIRDALLAKSVADNPNG
jgi:acyl carrier protein